MLIALILMAEAPPSIAQALQDALGGACPAASANEISVCGRHGGNVRSRFRLPEAEDRGFDPDGPIDSISRERNRLIDADGGGPDLTRGSCSAVGASGATGCSIKGWREGSEQRGKY